MKPSEEKHTLRLATYDIIDVDNNIAMRLHIHSWIYKVVLYIRSILIGDGYATGNVKAAKVNYIKVNTYKI